MSLTLASHTALLDHAGCVLWSRARPGAPWLRSARQDTPLAALSTLLAGKKGRLTLYLAGTLAQPLLLPWIDGLDSREAWHGYAAHTLAQRFGRTASDWHLSWRLPAYRQSALVAGMNPALWDELQALPLALGPVRPLFGAVLGHWARRLGRDGTLLLLERRSVQWALRRNRRWHEMGVVTRNPQQSLPQLLATLNALGIVGTKPPHLLVADPGLIASSRALGRESQLGDVTSQNSMQHRPSSAMGINTVGLWTTELPPLPPKSGGLLTLPPEPLHWALPIFAQGH